MAEVFQQTGDALAWTPCAGGPQDRGCDGIGGLGAGGSGAVKQVEWGAAGGGNYSITHPGSGQGTVYLIEQWAKPGSGARKPSLLSGSWVLKLNKQGLFATGLTIARIFVCRINSSCVNQERIARDTSSHSISNGVNTFTLTGNPTAWNSGDAFVWQVAFSNNQAFPQNVTFKHDQALSYPLAADDPKVHLHGCSIRGNAHVR